MKQHSISSIANRWRRKRFCRPPLASLIVAFAVMPALLLFTAISTYAQPAERDVMREIFTDIGNDGINPDDKAEVLPYKDGTMLRSVREPLYGNYSISSPSSGANSVVTSQKITGIFGKGGKMATAITDANGYKLETANKMPTLPAVVTVGGKPYSMELLTILNTYEGDFDGDGKRNELAFVIGARTIGTAANRSDMLLLCVGDASLSSDLTVVSILYEGPATGYGLRFRHITDWIGRTDIVCADVDGNGVDEIIAAVPTNKFTKNSKGTASDGFVKQINAMIWSVDPSKKGTEGWKQTANWQEPKEVYANTYRNDDLLSHDIYIGAAGATVSLAAGDLDRDGREDVVVAISSVNGTYNQYRKSDYHSIVALFGAKNLNDIIADYSIDSDLSSGIHNRVSEGAAGIDPIYAWTAWSAVGCLGVTISDVDGTGNLSLLLAYKYIDDSNTTSGDEYYNSFVTEMFFVFCMDFNGKRQAGGNNVFLMHYGPLSFDGQFYGTDNTALLLSRTNPVHTRPFKIAALRYDYGMASGKSYVLSSGSFVLDGIIYSFVKRNAGGKYIVETKYQERVVPDILDPNNSTNIANGYGFHYGFYYKETTPWTVLPSMYGAAVENKQYIYELRSASINGDSDGFLIVKGNGRDSSVPVVEYYDATSTSGTKRAYKSNRYVSSSNWSFASLGSGWESERAIMAAFPNSGRSVYLKYNNQHAFFWSDPVIVTALASPPYFEALPSDQYVNSSTSYGKTTTTTNTNTVSFSTTRGSAIETEISAGILGIGGSWQSETEQLNTATKGQENSMEVSYTHQFTTYGGENTVVLVTAAYDAYGYTAYYLDQTTGTATSAPFKVLVPRGGESALKVASVKYEDYQEMRRYTPGGLPDLSTVFNHTIGRPETYLSSSSNLSAYATTAAKSILESELSTFPSNSSSQTLSMEIDSVKTSMTSTATSVTAKMGGGFKSEGDLLGVFNVGSSVSVSSVDGKESEYGKIISKANGISFEGVVYGQGDGINAGGSGPAKASFNWKLLRYVYSNRTEVSKSNGTKSLQEFPVVTYITTGVTQPAGVSPSSITVTGDGSGIIEQVGNKTPGHKSSADYTAILPDIVREARTELVGAPLGMTLDLGGSNIGSTPYYFSVVINSGVQPGTYNLQLAVGGVLSNTFTLRVTPYVTPPPVTLESDKPVVDFGKIRYNYAGYDGQWFTLHNNSIVSAKELKLTTKSITESYFDLVDLLFPITLAPNETRDIFVRPKAGLAVGTYHEDFEIYNEDAVITIPVSMIITPPTTPSAPKMDDSNKTVYVFDMDEAALNLTWGAPDDDGGLPVRYNVRVVENYGEDLEVISDDTIPGTSWNFTPPDYGHYRIFVYSVNDAGHSNTVPVYMYDVERNYDGVVGATLTVGNTQLVCNWSEVRGDAPEGYEVKVDDGEWTRDMFKEGDFYYGYSYFAVFSNLRNGLSYDISVRAYYTDGTTGPITTVTGTPSAKLMPPVKNLQASARDGHVVLTWEAPDDGSYDYCVNVGNTYYHNRNSFFYDRTGMTNGQPCIFAVTATPKISQAVSEGTPVYIIATPQEGLPDEPSAPKNAAVRIGNDNTVTVSWDAPDNDGGSEILGYEIEHGVLGAEYRYEYPAATDREYTYGAVDENWTENIHLRATNAVGGGSQALMNYTMIKLSGNKILSLPAGYTNTDAGGYTLSYDTGRGYKDCSADYEWSIKSTDNPAITWDNTERKIKIASGLAPGEYNAVLQAKVPDNPYDSFKTFFDFYFTLTVCDVPVVATTTLPDGLLGFAYNAMPLEASGGGSTTWSVDGGALPTGLTLLADGTLTGVPTQIGPFTFTVKAQNDKGSGTKQFSITVSDFYSPTQAFAITFGTIGSNGTISATVDGESISSDDVILEGKTVVFTAMPVQGFLIKSWTDNDATVNGTATIYTLSNIAAAHNVNVEFSVITDMDKPQTDALKVDIKEGQLHVSGLTEGQQWFLYNVPGALLYQSKASSNEAYFPLPVRGVYIVRSNDQMIKVVY